MIAEAVVEVVAVSAVIQQLLMAHYQVVLAQMIAIQKPARMAGGAATPAVVFVNDR